METAARVEDFPMAQTGREPPSVLHYTSGTTGQPKGAQHVHCSLIAQYLTTKWVLDLQHDDIYWCTADPGWVTGTTYGIIGPWALRRHPVRARLRLQRRRAGTSSSQNHRVTVWYSAPTAIRSLMKEGRRGRQAARPLLAAPPLQRRRAAQRRGGDLVGEGLRPAVPRHLLADRDRLHHDHQLPRA